MRCPSNLLLLALLALASCGSPGPATQAWKALPAAQQQAASALYAQRCATCHGADGRGHGPSADGLPIADFTTLAWPGNEAATALIERGSDQGMPPQVGFSTWPEREALLLYLRRFAE
jgi:mono/diheme cytochrome c family protein